MSLVSLFTIFACSGAEEGSSTNPINIGGSSGSKAEAEKGGSAGSAASSGKGGGGENTTAGVGGDSAGKGGDTGVGGDAGEGGSTTAGAGGDEQAGNTGDGGEAGEGGDAGSGEAGEGGDTGEGGKGGSTMAGAGGSKAGAGGNTTAGAGGSKAGMGGNTTAGAGGKAPSCGDGVCDSGETCGNCAADCAINTCPSSAGVKQGGGLIAIDACAFPMKDTQSWQSKDAILAALAKVLPVKNAVGVIADVNRQGVAVSSVPGLKKINRGMKWEPGDMSVSYWIPQGITGSGDAANGKVGGKDIVLSSWYYAGDDPDRGVRIAFVDLATNKYRFALLVEPVMDGSQPSFKAVASHAGGIVWYGNYLYVAQTSKGFRVFDMSRILQVATDSDSIGYSAGAYNAYKYKYVIPQIGYYQQTSACDPVFSFTALDRSTNPPSLVSGEYVSGKPNGRLYRWSLDPTTGRLAGGNLFVPTEAFFSGQNNIQGAASYAKHWLLSSSAPAAGKGALYRVAVGSSSTLPWSDSPEDLSIDHSTGELWGQSEVEGARYIYSMPLSNYK